MSPPPRPENGKTQSAQTERLEIYKLMVEMADRVSQRRQAANSFYLSINSLLLSGAAYLSATSAPIRSAIFIAVSGILVSIYWIRSIESYRTLNKAKFEVINDIESGLAVRPFTDEWAKLDPDGDGIRYKPFHVTERLVPRVFIGMYAFQTLAALPWKAVAVRLLSAAC